MPLKPVVAWWRGAGDEDGEVGRRHVMKVFVDRWMSLGLILSVMRRLEQGVMSDIHSSRIPLAVVWTMALVGQ